METSERVAEGMSEAEARRTALADFGSRPACTELVRETWDLRLWADIGRDFSYAFRVWRRRPAFAAVTALMLCIGIGANTAVFSVFDRAILRPLPYEDPDRLLHLWEARENEEFSRMAASYPNFLDWKRQAQSFVDIAGYNGTNFTLTGLGFPSRTSALRVTANMLPVLGVRPQLGRGFLPQEEEPANANVVILTHGFWMRHFAEATDVLGKHLRLNGVPYTIVGVMAEDFRFGPDASTEMLVPLGATSDQLQRRRLYWLNTIARLKPDVDLNAAEIEMKTIAGQLAASLPETNAGTSVQLVPLHAQFVGELKPVLTVIFLAATCMLALSWASLANLMSAQSVARQRELAIRTALGAGRFRLARQFIVECLVLAFAAGTASIGVAGLCLIGIMTVVPQALLGSIRGIGGSQIDGRMILFGLALTLLAGLVGGSVAALRLRGQSANEVIKGSVASPGGQKMRTVFTVAEIAFSVTLIIAAVVMIQSVRRLLQIDPGFRVGGLVAMQLSLPSSTYRSGEDVAAFYKELQRSVAALPGVTNGAVVDELPLTTDSGTVYIYPQSQPQPRSGDEPEAAVRSASQGYFETMGITLVRGRTFTGADLPTAPRVLILNETLARRLFGDRDPIGERIVMPASEHIWNVVGVVGDVHLADLDRPVRPTVYTSSLQDPSRSAILVVRTKAGVADTVEAVRGVVMKMDADLPVYRARSMEETVNMTSGVAVRKLVLNLVTAFGCIGALMAGVGLYGLMSFSVSQRAKEIAIRIAMGAERGNVRRLVLSQALKMTGLGFGVGLAMAVAGTQLMRGLMFGISPWHPGVLMWVLLLVGVIMFAACMVPVWRATRIDPIQALRHD